MLVIIHSSNSKEEEEEYRRDGHDTELDQSQLIQNLDMVVADSFPKAMTAPSPLLMNYIKKMRKIQKSLICLRANRLKKIGSDIVFGS